MNLAKLSIKRPTFIFALLMALLVLGVTFFNKMSVRMMPDVEFPYVLVMTSYQGAGAEEIEQQISKPIEDALSGISGLKHVQSQNQDNMSIVFCEFELSKNPDVAAQEVRDKISLAVRSLPDEIDTPIIMKADMNSMPLMSFSLRADMNSNDLYDFADTVMVKELAQIEGVSQVNIVGGTKREIHVNANKKKLKDYQMNLSMLAGRIQANSLNVPAGKVDRGAIEMSYRTIGEFQHTQDISDVVVNFVGNDIPVKVKDVATVVDSRQKDSSIGRLSSRDENGNVKSEPSLLLMVFRQAKSNDVKISDTVRKKTEELNKKYESATGNPHLTMISDSAEGVRKNIKDVQETLLIGILLAIVVVYFFLGSWRSTFITALALPNSLIGSFVFMYLAGFSINVLSLMSLSLAVGLLIDDAIVVRENIFRHYEKGKDPIQAALDGTNEVTLAVIATTASVIAVFAPVAFLSGLMGQFFKEFGLTVVFAMLISVLDALTIAPMLSAYFIPSHEKVAADAKKTGTLRNFFRGVTKVFRALTVDWFNKVFDVISSFYNSVITLITKSHLWRIAAILLAIGFLGGTILLAKNTLEMSFMPSSDWGEFTVDVEAKPGTSLNRMNEYAKEIEKILMKEESIEIVSTSVGSSGMLSNAANTASFNVKMVPAKQRSISMADLRGKLRKDFKQIFGDTLEIAIKSQTGMGADSDLLMELRGGDLELLYDVSLVLQKRFQEIPYLTDIHSNFKLGKPETQIIMDKVKMEKMGVNSVEAGSEIRAMIDGVVAGKYRHNGNEYDIKVQLPDNQKDIVNDLDNIYIYNVNGRLIKIDNVAKVVEAGGPTTIYRKDKIRFITVEGNLDKGGTIGTVQKEAIKIFNEEKEKPENAERWKDIQVNLAGDSEMMAETFQSIVIAAALAILFIFLVLASLYESVITPFTIMLALPLAIIGGLLALILTHQPIDMFTMIGMIMLLGIVAKNSILLIDYAQQKIRGGMEISDALIKAGGTRLRPILMTSVALIAGMLPTALGLSEVGAFRKGMGIVVIGGVISSTVLTLLVVPAVFEYMDSFRHFIRRLLGRPEMRMHDYTDEELEKKNLL